MSKRIEFTGSRLVFYTAMLFVIIILLAPPLRILFLNLGLRWIYILLLSFSLSFCLTPISSWMAYRFNILDNPDARKTHQESTPLLGGVAVFIAFISAILANAIFSLKLEVILVAATVLCGIGIADDAIEVPAWIKLAAQILCTVFVMGFGIVLKIIPEQFGILSDLGNIILTVLWIVGITNAMNFFDGMDGLAVGLSGLVSFFLGVVAFQTDQPFLGWVSVALMGSCLGFLPYNLRLKKNAAIFLGDAGSTVLGFILACLAVYGNWSENDPVVALASPLLIFWIFIFDMVHITIDRIMTGKVHNLHEWIDYVGTDHLHHRLALVLEGKKKSVLFIYLMSFCLGVSAILLRNATAVDAVLLIAQATIMVLLITVLERRGRSMV